MRCGSAGLLRAWRPALLVTNNWGAIEWAMANLLPVARHVHIEDGFGPEERNRQLPRRALIRRLVLARSTVVLPSRNLQRIATTIWRLPPARVRYIPNGIDLERFAAARTEPRAGNTPPVVGTVAALRAGKEPRPPAARRSLRRTAGAAGDRRRRAGTSGAGGTWRGRSDWGNACGLPGTSTIRRRVYAGFDVFALSSDTEQMPLSVIEAMAAGLPVAATDVGDVRAMLAAENAPFVGKLDDSDLARSLTALLGRCRVALAHRRRQPGEGAGRVRSGGDVPGLRRAVAQ